MSSKPPQSDARAQYIVQCWSCLGEFDALDSVWCSCDPKSPSRLCPFCLQCFCGASKDYKEIFWRSAPELLRQEIHILSEAKEKLGEVLIRSNLLTTDQLIKALEYQKMRQCPLGEALVELGFVAKKDIDYFLSRQETVTRASLDEDFVPKKELFKKLPPKFCYEKLIIPLDEDHIKDDVIITVAMADPKDVNLIDLIQTKTDAKIIPYQATAEKIKEILEATFSKAELVPREEDTVDVKKLAQNLILGGVKNRASDIYIEPKEEFVQINYRIDGILFKHKPISVNLKNGLFAELRSMVGLKDKSSGQIESGRTVIRSGVKKYEMSLQTFPSLYGENISVKLINREEFFKDIDMLGVSNEDLRKLKKVLIAPARVALVTGPIMNGTATTAYSIARYLAARGRKVSTIESHILAGLEDVQQIQVAEGEFPRTLQSLIRTYPEVIILSDLPDAETANLVLKLGARVFMVAVMEASNSAETLEELMRRGVSARDIASTLGIVINQRLVRKICENCKKETKSMPAMLQRAGFSAAEIPQLKTFSGGGCDACHHTGYSGRVPIFEILEITQQTAAKLSAGVPPSAIVNDARAEGMKTLRESCIELIMRGVTTVEEFEKGKFF